MNALTITWNDDRTWVSDENGNRCSVAYFGTEADAEAALKSLIGCKGCVNCSDCSDCSRCSDCSDCSRCSRCSDCSRCSRCSDCSDCSDCSGLKGRDGVKSEGETAPETPVIPNIDAAIYAAASAPEALDMGNWHTCGTTHCRAGWAVHLAGEAGYALESFHNTALAAQLIHRASGAPISPVKFYEGNEAAMADMRKRAGVDEVAQ